MRMRRVLCFLIVFLVAAVPVMSAGFNNTWEELLPAGSIPSARSGQAMVYDTQYEVVILFGGRNTTHLNDTWIYNFTDNKWSDVSSTGAPTNRSFPGMVYDSKNQRTILWGGLAGGGVQFNETWVYNYTDNVWYNVTTSGVSIDYDANVYDPAVAYDSLRGLVFSVGGHTGGGIPYENDTHVYNFTDNLWINMGPGLGPRIGRDGAEMVYDELNDRLVMFGGFAGASYGVFNETWIYNYTSNLWYNLTDPTSRPYGGQNPTMAYDNNFNRTVVFSGQGSAVKTNETTMFNFTDSTWTNMLTDPSPPNMTEASMIFNPTDDMFLFFGGWDGTLRHAGTWSYKLYDEVGIPSPWFSWTPTPTYMSDIITMEDLSITTAETGDSSDWEWDWGDDFNTTNDTGFQNMTHTYSRQPGQFVINFNVSTFNQFTRTNATHRSITVSGIRVMAWEELSPSTNVTFNISLTNGSATYSEDVSSGVFIWRNVSQGIPTGSLTITISKTNFESRQYVETFNSESFINLTAYLIASNDCVTQPFLVRDSKGAFIEGATITANKTVNGVNRVVGQKDTDSAGSASLCLDPNALHTIVVVATGFQSLTKNINPTTSTLLITLGGEIAPPTFTANQTFYFFLNPFGNLLNKSHDTIIASFQDPQCTIQWFELNVSNETAVANSSIILDQPCSGGLEAVVNATTGLKDLPYGTKIIASLFAYSNRSNNATYNHTYYIAGPQSNMSAARGLEILKDDFSQGGQAMIAVIVAMAGAATFSVLFGFGAGLIAVAIGGIFWINGYIWTDIFVLAALVAVTSLLSKRWQ